MHRRALAFGGFVGVAHLRVFRHFAGRRVFGFHHAVFHVLVGIFRRIHFDRIAGLLLLAFAFAVFGIGVRIGIAVLVAAFVRVGGALVHHVEALQHLVDRLAEGRLILEANSDKLSSSSPARSSMIGRQRSTSFCADFGAGQTGQFFAHQHRDRIFERRVVALSDTSA